MVVEMAQLFSPQRIGDSKTAVILALYFPLGLILAVLRLFIGLHVFIIACILPIQVPFRRALLRTMYTVLGFIVYPSNQQYRNPNVKVIVANHVSVLDHVIIGLIFPSVVPNVWSLPPFLNWALGYTNMGATQGRQVFLDAVRKHCRQDTRPVLAFPEGAMTNGKAGILKFSTWAFSLERDVQPMTVTISRPLLNIKAEVLGSSLWQDLLWFLFVPFTVYRIKVLPVEERSDFENADDFSRSVREIMADDMGLISSPFTSADKAEYVKKLGVQQPRERGTQPPQVRQTINTPPRPSGASPRSFRESPVDKMIKQVQEVMPHIPAHIIRKDLETTRSVDATIFNILENKTEIPIPAEEVPSSSTGSATPLSTPHTSPQSLPHNTFCMTSQDSPSSTLSTPSPACTKFAADKFGSSSRERQLSLQERKAALLANARKRFTETSKVSN
nr:lipid droplet-regulating VLDL assembly factor AUP1-like [Lytechinus pictus]